MGNHIHLLVWVDDAQAARIRLAAVVSGIARQAGMRGRIWQPVGKAEPIASTKLGAQVRYIALNPCRADLTNDPLAWVWSTHRDVVGASVDPWVTADRLAAALGQTAVGFARNHHRFVSDDAKARTGGTPFPLSAPMVELSELPLARIAAAARAALRAENRDIKLKMPARRLFVQLAIEQGWTSPCVLKQAIGASRSAVWRLARSPDEAALSAGRLCLGDERLRFGLDSGARSE